MQDTKEVLIVDDEEMFHEYIEAVIDIKNIHFVNAYNGQEGLALYLEHDPPFSLVLLDIKMPVMNGVEFLRALARKQSTICPVIVLSGWLTEEDKANCIAFGAKEVLPKPILPEVLRSRTHYYLTSAEQGEATPENNN